MACMTHEINPIYVDLRGKKKLRVHYKRVHVVDNVVIVHLFSASAVCPDIQHGAIWSVFEKTQTVSISSS